MIRKRFFLLITTTVLLINCSGSDDNIDEAIDDNIVVNQDVSEITVTTQADEAPLDFGWEYPNFDESTKFFTVTNTGDTKITLQSIDLPNGYSLKDAFSVTTLNPSENINYYVNFFPQSVGTYTGTITVNSDAKTGKSNFEVTGKSSLTVSDNDGNEYNLVVVGDQIWLAENFRGTTYVDGSSIEHSFFTDTQQDHAYGKFYPNSALFFWNRSLNRVVTKDLMEDFRVPYNTDWNNLFTNLGGTAVAGSKLKETGTLYWDSPNRATNSSDFSARGAGSISGSTSYNFNEFAFFWSYKHSTSGGTSSNHVYTLFLTNGSIDADLDHNANYSSRYSVRLVKTRI